MAATARLWITALYNQDDSREIAREAENMAKAEEFMDQRGLPYHRSRLQNGTVDLSVEVPLDEALPLLRELKRAGIFYGSIDAIDVAEDDSRLDALLSFDPHLILSVEV